MLDKLIHLLDLPDTDYWSDVACEDARKIIDDSPEEVLILLLNEWKNWPATRQEHLAYILGESNSSNERKLIEAMLKSPNSDIVSRAKEALDGIVKNA